jgi:hypothetical protein
MKVIIRIKQYIRVRIQKGSQSIRCFIYFKRFVAKKRQKRKEKKTHLDENPGTRHHSRGQIKSIVSSHIGVLGQNNSNATLNSKFQHETMHSIIYGRAATIRLFYALKAQGVNLIDIFSDVSLMQPSSLHFWSTFQHHPGIIWPFFHPGVSRFLHLDHQDQYTKKVFSLGPNMLTHQ